jgi:hypothetical protein
VVGVVLLGLGNAVADLDFVILDWRGTDNSVVVFCLQSRDLETICIKWLSLGIVVVKLLISCSSG